MLEPDESDSPARGENPGKPSGSGSPSEPSPIPKDNGPKGKPEGAPNSGDEETRSAAPTPNRREEGFGHGKPADEDSQKEADRERWQRTRGLGYMVGPGWYAGAAADGEFYNVVAGGDAQFNSAERDINIGSITYAMSGTLETVPRFGPLPWQDLEPHKARHVRTASDTELRDHVKAGGVIVLSGPAGSGRRDSAVWALASVLPPARTDTVEIAEVTTINGLLSGSSRQDAGRPRGWVCSEGHGYVLDATELHDPINRSVLDDLRYRLGDVARLIILADDQILAEDVRLDPGLVVRHDRPELSAVFEQHLWRRLRNPPSEVRTAAWELLDSTDLADEVHRLDQPQDAVRLAVELALQLTGERSVKEIIEELPERRRRTLREDIHGNRRDHRERSLLVAAAAFQGMPVGTVTRAYERLIRLLPDKRLKAEPFRRGLAECWSAYVRGFDGLDEPEAERGADPEIVFRPPSLGREVLTVAWRDYPALRPILLQWLTMLIHDENDYAVRAQAAQTVGVFASLDFDEISRTTFRNWRTHPSHRKREAFLHAAEATAGTDEHTADRIRRWLRVGMREQNIPLEKQYRLTEAYRTKIGALFPDDAMRAIDELIDCAARQGIGAAPASRKGHSEVEGFVNLTAEIITEIFAAGATRQVLAELHRWTTIVPGPENRTDDRTALLMQWVAAGTMARIARLPVPGPAGDRPPALLRAAADGEISTTQLIPIWRNALADLYVGSRSWEVLETWVRAPDADAALAEPVREIVRTLAEESLLQRRRLTHRIATWQRLRGRPYRAFLST